MCLFVTWLALLIFINRTQQAKQNSIIVIETILPITCLRSNASLNCPGKHLDWKFYKHEAGEELLAKHVTHDIRLSLHPVWQC